MSQSSNNLSQTAPMRQVEFSDRFAFLKEISTFVASVTLADQATWRLHSEARRKTLGFACRKPGLRKTWTASVQDFSCQSGGIGRRAGLKIQCP